MRNVNCKLIVEGKKKDLNTERVILKIPNKCNFAKIYNCSVKYPQDVMF